MYKTEKELMEMTVGEIMDYLAWLEGNDRGAQENSFEFQDWFMGTLMDVLDAKDGWAAFEERYGR